MMRLVLPFVGTGSSSEGLWMVRGAASALVVRLLALGLSFLSVVLLGHLLGAEEYGRYSVAMALFATCAPIAGLGLSAIMTREVAATTGLAAAKARPALACFLLRTSLMSGSLVGAALASAVVLLSHVGGIDGAVRSAALAVALLIPVTTLVAASGALQNGLGRILEALSPGQVVQPLALCLLALVLLACSGRESATGTEALGLQLVGAAAALVAAIVFLLRQMELGTILRSREHELPAPPRRYFAGGLKLVVTGMLAALQSQAAILLLGVLIGAEVAGPYQAASRTALLLLVLYNAAWATLGPLAARKTRNGDRAGLQRDVNLFLALAVLPMLPVAFVFIAQPAFVLHIFGSGFAVATLPLQILTVAALFQIASGPAYLLLIAANAETYILRASLMGMVINVVLNLALIPPLGMAGAAVATLASAIFQKCFLVVHAERLTGVRSTVLIWLDLLSSKSAAQGPLK